MKLVDRSVDNGVGMPKICGHDSCGLVVFGSKCSIFSSKTCGCGHELDSLVDVVDNLIDNSGCGQ